MSVLLATVAAVLMVLVVGAAVNRRTIHCVAAERSSPGSHVVDDNRSRRLLTRCIAGFHRRRAERSRRDVDASAVAALLDRTARQCASGQSLTRSFAESLHASPIAPLFATTSAAIDGGQSVDQALEHQSTIQPNIALAVHAIRLCARQGGNVSESLDRAASTLRDRATASHERHAQSAQARLSARVLTVLPIAFGGWTIATTPSVQRFVLTPAGLACITAGLALNVIGWYSMSRVVKRSG